MNKIKNFQLSDSAYNFIKWFLITFIPALTLLINTLGTIYVFDTKVINLTIGAITTFLGTITGISNYNYKKESE